MPLNRRQLFSHLAALGIASGLSRPLLAASKEAPIIVDGLDTSKMDEAFIQMLRQGGVDCVHKSMGDAVHFGEIYYFIEQHSKDLMLAKSVADIQQAKAEGKIAVVLGQQGTGYYEGALRKAGRYSALTKTLQAYHGLGLRILMVAYNTNNLFGGGNLNPRSPLTRAGQVLVEEMHKLNIILDVGGHVGEQTSLDAIAISKGIPAKFVRSWQKLANLLVPMIR